MMDIVLSLLMLAVTWKMLCLRYQRDRIVFLRERLARFELERHMETLTQGYLRAIHEQDATRQRQVLDSFAPTEDAVARQAQTLADTMRTESAEATAMGRFAFCVPWVERVFPALTRDFRQLLQIHADGLRRVVDDREGRDAKERAFHLSAELYLFQHSCHWFCKSRTVADARLVARHQVTHQKVLESVSEATRAAYLRWLDAGGTQ